MQSHTNFVRGRLDIDSKLDVVVLGKIKDLLDIFPSQIFQVINRHFKVVNEFISSRRQASAIVHLLMTFFPKLRVVFMFISQRNEIRATLQDLPSPNVHNATLADASLYPPPPLAMSIDDA